MSNKSRKTEVVQLKPVVSHSQEEFKPKVQAFLYPHDNDALLIHPQKNFTKTLLDKMFAPRPKKVLPQIREKKSRHDFYKNVKDDEVTTGESLRKESIDKVKARQSVYVRPSIMVPSTGATSTGNPPLDSPKTRQSIFDVTFKTKFSQDFLHSMISVQDKDKANKKRGSHMPIEEDDADESRMTVSDNESVSKPATMTEFPQPSHQNSRERISSNIEGNSSSANIGRERVESSEKLAQKTDLNGLTADAARKRNVTMITPSKKSEEGDLSTDSLRKRTVTVVNPNKQIDSTGLTPEPPKQGNSTDTGSPIKSEVVERTSILKRRNSSEQSPNKKADSGETTEQLRKRNVTVISPSKKTGSSDLNADSARKRTATVVTPSK